MNLLSRAAAIFLLTYSAMAFAGETIHFSGVLKSEKSMTTVFQQARAYAGSNGWSIDETYSNATTLVLLPHPQCEPVVLRFNGTQLTPAFSKTVLAGYKTHQQVLGLFKKLGPAFDKLNVHDESEYE
jgi:hypothetical protein